MDAKLQLIAAASGCSFDEAGNADGKGGLNLIEPTSKYSRTIAGEGNRLWIVVF